jgi:hypothetical protein
MSEPTSIRIPGWAAPVLLTAVLTAAGGFLCLLNEKLDHLSDKLDAVSIRVARLEGHDSLALTQPTTPKIHEPRSNQQRN